VDSIKSIILFDNVTHLPISIVHGDSSYVPPKDRLFLCVDMDPDTETWSGTCDTGRIIKINEVCNSLYESDIDTRCRNAISVTYPIEKQIGIIQRQLSAFGLPLTDEFQKMYTFIEETRKINKNIIHAAKYSDRITYKSEDQEVLENNEKLDHGGFESRGQHDIDKPITQDMFL